jgi:serine/threonine protein kinase
VQIVSFSVDLLDRIFPSVDAFAQGCVPVYDEQNEIDIIQSARSARKDDIDYEEEEIKQSRRRQMREEEKDEEKVFEESKHDEAKNEMKQQDGKEEEGEGGTESKVYIVANRYRVKTFPVTAQGEADFRSERRLLSRIASLSPFFPIRADLNSSEIAEAAQKESRPARASLLLQPMSGQRLSLITHRPPRGDLWRLIHFPPDEIPCTSDDAYLANFYYAQTLVAVAKLHELNLAWRGICPENIGIDEKGNTVLLDLSMCGDVSDERKKGIQRLTMCGTPEYMAPEMICGTGHGKAVDMWALGVLLHELYWGFTPFSNGGRDSDPQKRHHNDVRKLERILKVTTDWDGTMSHTIALGKGDPTLAVTLAARVVNNLVQPLPASRQGYLHPDGPMHVIDSTNLFDALELDLLITGRLRAPRNIPYDEAH